MPNYGSSKQNTGSAKPGAGQPASKNYDMGQLNGFGTNKGSRREGKGLKNDDGGGGGKFVDTFNDASGEGHGGRLKKPRAGDA
jgi:hypothetical protein